MCDTKARGWKVWYSDVGSPCINYFLFNLRFASGQSSFSHTFTGQPFLVDVHTPVSEAVDDFLVLHVMCTSRRGTGVGRVGVVCVLA